MIFDKTHAFYAAWGRMRSRCNDKNRDNYKYYGGRGISCSKEWDSFEVFKNDMYESWLPGLVLDRIDNNGNYCKENCRWVMKEDSLRNKRNAIFSEEKAEEIRRRYKAGERQISLARAFGVSKQDIWRIVHNKSWA